MPVMFLNFPDPLLYSFILTFDFFSLSSSRALRRRGSSGSQPYCSRSQRRQVRSRGSVPVTHVQGSKAIQASGGSLRTAGACHVFSPLQPCALHPASNEDHVAANFPRTCACDSPRGRPGGPSAGPALLTARDLKRGGRVSGRGRPGAERPGHGSRPLALGSAVGGAGLPDPRDPVRGVDVHNVRRSPCSLQRLQQGGSPCSHQRLQQGTRRFKPGCHPPQRIVATLRNT